MAPDPGASDHGKRTVACNFESLVPYETHKVAIRDAVQCTHRATILATELRNMHVRRCLEERSGVGLDQILTPNWFSPYRPYRPRPAHIPPPFAAPRVLTTRRAPIGRSFSGLELIRNGQYQRV